MNKNDLLKSDFVKNVSFQIIGIGLAQLLPLLCMPFLTRIYSETDFALYTSFIAVGSVFAVGAGARYQYAIMLPKKQQEAHSLFLLSIILSLIYALFLLGIFLFFPSISFNMGRTVYLVPIFVLFFGVWNACSNLSIRNTTFLHNSVAKVLQSIVYILVSLGLGLGKVFAIGLILGRLSGTLGSGLYLFKKSGIKIRKPNYSRLKFVAKKYKDYPKYGFIPAFLDTASGQAMVFIIMQFYSKPDLGYFGLTLMVLNAPVALVGASFKEVFYQKITVLINDSKFDKSLYLFKTSALVLFIIGLPFCVILFFVGEQLFSIIFGLQWSISGRFASILSFAFLIQLVVSPLSSIFNAANRLKIASYWQTLHFITTFSTFGIAAWILKVDLETLLYIYVLHELLLYSIYFILQFKTLKKLK